MEETQERSLQRDAARLEPLKTRIHFSELDQDIQLAVLCAAEKKGIDLKVLDLRQIAAFTEYFILVTGTNQRQVQAIADEITEQLKKQHGTSPNRVEGYGAAEWVLLDYGDFVVHVFDKEAREFYDLERLWRDAQKVEMPADL